MLVVQPVPANQVTFLLLTVPYKIKDMDTVAGLVNGNYHGTAKNLRGEKLQISDRHIISASLKAGIISY